VGSGVAETTDLKVASVREEIRMGVRKVEVSIEVIFV
jgi:hypothetical protein